MRDWTLPDTTAELLAMPLKHRCPQVRRVLVGDLPDPAQHTLDGIFNHHLMEPLRRSLAAENQPRDP
ncbi:MAG: hypothetical protein ACUVSQ_05945 [Pseudanabaenaceae cyanobacterium]